VTPSNMRLTRSRVAPRLTRLGWRVHSSLNVSTRVLAVFRTCTTRVTPCLAHLIISRSSAGVARRSAGVASSMGLWRSGIRRSCSCGRSPRGEHLGSGARPSASGARYRRGGRPPSALKDWRASPGMASGRWASRVAKLRFRERSSLPIPRAGYTETL